MTTTQTRNFDHQTLTNQTIELDGGSFIGATLTRCRLIYRGGPLPLIGGLTLVEPTWDFEDGALRALIFLTMIGRSNPTWPAQILAATNAEIDRSINVMTQ